MKSTLAPYKEFLALAAVVVLTVIIAYAVQRYLPSAVKKPWRTIDDIPVEWEVKFKDRAVKFLAFDANILEDENIAEAVETIRYRLISNMPETPYDIEVIVVESPVANAVTFPGGLIAVFTPLIRLCDTPEELAAVLAHEIGHVVKRDPLQRFIRQVGISAVFALFKGGESTVLLEDAIRQLIEVRYTQKQEEEADRFALKLLADSGIDPANFAAFMEKLSDGGDDATEGVNKYLRTHPPVSDRIAKACKASEEFGQQQKPFALDWNAVRTSLPSVFASRK